MILTLQGWLYYWDGLVPSSAFIPQVGALQISSHFLTLSLEKETKNLLYLKSTLLCMLASKEIRTEQVCTLSLVSNLTFCELPYWIAERPYLNSQPPYHYMLLNTLYFSFIVGFLNLGIIDILGWVFLYVRKGAVLYIVGCWATPLASTTRYQ